MNYDAAARIAHLIATRNVAIAALERAHCRNPLCCEVELIATGLMDKEVAERGVPSFT